MITFRTLKRTDWAAPEPSACPVGKVLERHQRHIHRELCHLGHAIDLCRCCERAHGPCGRFRGFLSKFQKAIPQALKTLGLGLQQ